MRYEVIRTERFEPGPLVPFTGHGSIDEGSETGNSERQHWLQASQGLIEIRVHEKIRTVRE